MNKIKPIPKTVNERCRKHRQKIKALGLRPIQIVLPSDIADAISYEANLQGLTRSQAVDNVMTCWIMDCHDQRASTTDASI